MRLGVVFPQTEAGTDPGAIREFVLAAADAGYDHFVAGHHDLGVAESEGRLANAWPSELPRSPYALTDEFHDVFVLFGFVAALCDLELMSNVLVLPQRQTVPVAKAAAEIDLLSGGGLRLGVGLGWNRPEFEAMGVDYASRARRFEEQLEVLRLLWSRQEVTFHGEFHSLEGVGLAPMPSRRPIPLWIGSGGAPAALDRVGRLADGWTPVQVPGHGVEQSWEKVRAAAEKAGRDPDTLGLQGFVPAGDRDGAAIRRRAERWRALGATHLAVETWRAGLRMPQDHIAAIRTAAEALR